MISKFIALRHGAALALLMSAPQLLRAQVLLSPTSPRLQDVVRLAQESNGDSARSMMARILKATAPTDTGYPEVLFTAGLVAGTSADAATYFKRVFVEYPSSPWADKAEMRVAELSFGSGNMDDVLARVSRIFSDYPQSPVVPTAALWGARAAFEQQKVQQGCDWLDRGLKLVGDDIETRNQMMFAHQRCNIGPATRLAPPVSESLRAGPPPRSADSGHATPPIPVTPPPPPPPPATHAAASPWRVQVVAIADKNVIRRMSQKIEAAGFKAYAVPGPRGLTKVQAGPFATRAAAAAAVAKIRAAVGGAPFVTAAPE